MKKAVRLNCSGSSITILLFGIMAQNGQIFNKDSLDSDSHSVTSFICDNFAKFVSKFNEQSDDKWFASHISDSFDITIEDCGTTYNGVFLDFDSDNGYAVIGGNYMLYDFVISGESPYLNIGAKSTIYKYSTSNGYMYLSNGVYLSVNLDNLWNSNDSNHQFYDKHYDGQDSDSTGCGNIIRPDNYIKDRYGDGWSLEKRKSLGMNGHRQLSLSCYYENKISKDKSTGIENVETYSEGNCWFVSVYNVLRYMGNSQWFNLPSYGNMVSYNPVVSEPNLYSKYYDNSGNNITKKLYYNNNTSFVYQHYLRQPTFNFNKLYTDIRELVNAKYKKVDGGTISESCAIIERIAQKYNYSVDALEHFDWVNYVNSVANRIDQSIPSLWSTSNDTYGSHTMAVCGYRFYTKTTGWWIFKTKETKALFEIKDGWSEDSRFYDVSGHTGFSAIATLEF